MTEKIAVLVNSSGNTASFFEESEIRQYARAEDGWELVSRQGVALDRSKGISEFRKSFSEIIPCLSGCKVLVGREISGLPYNILDSKGFTIVQLEGEPAQFLEGLWQMMQDTPAQDASNPPGENMPPQPIEGPVAGNFAIDLIQIQSTHPALSSKKLLLPFLKNTSFHELEVLCSHVPPWFESQLEGLGLGFDAQLLSANRYKVVIFHKTCAEKGN